MSSSLWSTEDQKKVFRTLWQDRSHYGTDSSSKSWDECADEWEKGLREDKKRKARSDRRVSETAAWLRAHGLLAGNQTAVDIGCGPGRFVTEFARTAKHVTGIDLSPNMARYGQRCAEENGLHNTDFIACDFKTADIKERGWEKAFDLVFSSITPAVCTPEDVARIETMSRAYCFNSSFIHADDPLAVEALAEAMPGEDYGKAWDGRVFYSMFNLLWLRGRTPECTYFKESRVDRLRADDALVDKITQRIDPERVTPEVRQKMLRFLKSRADAEGFVDYPSERWYGWLLWDVRVKLDRSYFPF